LPSPCSHYLPCSRALRLLLSFPTRRSSDLSLQYWTNSMNVLCHSYGYANTALLFLQLSSLVCHPFLFQKQKRYLRLHYCNRSLCTAPCRNFRHNNKSLLDTWRIARQLRNALGYLPFSNNPTLHDATSYPLSKNPMDELNATLCLLLNMFWQYFRCWPVFPVDIKQYVNSLSILLTVSPGSQPAYSFLIVYFFECLLLLKGTLTIGN